MNEKDDYSTKAKFRFDINSRLLAVAFTIFALVISFNPSLLKNSLFVPLQLALSIPLLLSSIFARSSLATAKSRIGAWEEYGYFTFVIAYAFMINVVGILLSYSVNLVIGLVFLIFSFVMALTYSVFETLEDKTRLWSRVKKDLFFGLLIFIGGILPSINFHI